MALSLGLVQVSLQSGAQRGGARGARPGSSRAEVHAHTARSCQVEQSERAYTVARRPVLSDGAEDETFKS